VLPNTVPNPRVVQLQQEMETIRVRIADAKILRQMTDLHPEIVALRRKLDNLREECAREPARIPAGLRPMAPTDTSLATNPWATERERVEMELRELRDLHKQNEIRIAAHEQQKTKLDLENDTLFERRQDFLRRQQELQEAKSEWLLWKGHVDTISRILTAESQDCGMQFATMEEARVPGKPYAPTLNGVFMLSGAVGLGLAVVVVFLREMFDRSFREPARVKQVLGIPVLEAIGEIRVGEPSGFFRQNLLMKAIAGFQALCVAAMASMVYLSLEKPPVYESILERALALWPG
jgi:hypothetical protein